MIGKQWCKPWKKFHYHRWNQLKLHHNANHRWGLYQSSHRLRLPRLSLGERYLYYLQPPKLQGEFNGNKHPKMLGGQQIHPLAPTTTGSKTINRRPKMPDHQLNQQDLATTGHQTTPHHHHPSYRLGP